MFNRLFALAFLLAVFLAPFASLTGMVGAKLLSPEAAQQKSLCLMTGVGCGSGHVLLPALMRM